MSRYLIVLEKTGTGYSAYSPDLPGCVATGGTRTEVESNMLEAIRMHLEGLKSQGQDIPEPRSESSWIEVPAV